MAGKRFPLDNSFDDLRRETDALREAFDTLRSQLSQGLTGASAARSASPAGTSRGEASPRVRTADVSSKPFVDLRNAVRSATAATSDLQRGVKGVGDLAKIMGFDRAAKAADTLQKSIGGVRDAFSGLFEARKILAGLAVVAGVGVLALGGIQAAIKSITGRSVTLGETFELVMLSFKTLAAEAAFQVRRSFNELGGFFQNLFLGIGETISRSFGSIINTVGEQLTRFSGLINSLPEGLRSAIPGLQSLGDSLGQLGQAFTTFAPAIGAVTDSVGDQFKAASEGVQRAVEAQNNAIAESYRVTTAEVKRRISEVLKEAAKRDSEGESADQLFKDPKKALTTFLEEAKAKIKEVLPDGLFAEIFGTGKSSPESPRSVSDAGFSAGTTWAENAASGLDQAKPQISQEIVDALIMDPEREGEVIKSFSDFLKNLKNLFRENPIGFVGGLLGLGGGGGAAFATGGEVLSPAHYQRSAKGYARGGRPSWVPASDTIAAWLTPGEFVQPLGAVRRHGVQFMEALRRGLIDPAATDALMGRLAPQAPSPPATPAFAAGGPVGASGPAASSGPSPAFLVASRSTAQALLHGGLREELMRDMQSNPTYRAALGL